LGLPTAGRKYHILTISSILVKLETSHIENI